MVDYLTSPAITFSFFANQGADGENPLLPAPFPANKHNNVLYTHKGKLIKHGVHVLSLVGVHVLCVIGILCCTF